MKDDDYINLATRISEDNIKVSEADRKRNQLNEKRSRRFNIVSLIIAAVGAIGTIVGVVISIVK